MLTITASPHCIHSANAHLYLNRMTFILLYMCKLLSPFKLSRAGQGRAGQGRAGQGRAGQGRALAPQQM